jgi:hypothetical protein
VLKKFVGDKMSIEATSGDGRSWDVQVFDRGQLTKYSNVSEAELQQMATRKGMKPAPVGRR